MAGKNIKSLRSLAAKSVVDLMQIPSSTRLCSQLQQCSPQLLHYLLRFTQRRAPITLHQLQLIVCKSLKCVQLFNVDAHRCNISSAFKHLEAHAQDTEMFEVHIPRQNYEQLPLVALIRAMVSLRELELDLNHVNDAILEAVGHTCVLLVRLTVGNAKLITDVGLNALVPCVTHHGCPNLKEIVLESSTPLPGITLKSVVAVLENLHSLKLFEAPLVDKALVVLREVKPIEYKLNLEEYRDIRAAQSSSVRPTLKELLSKMLDICPRLHTVDLIVEGKDDITPLKKLEDARELSFRFGVADNSEWFFYIQIVPVLGSCGLNLRSLRLFMTDIDLGAIDENCPNLKQLHLEAVERCWYRKSGIARSMPSKRTFIHLEVLRVIPANAHSIHITDLNMLLNGGNVKEFYLGACDALDDVTMMAWIQEKRFENLTSVKLCHQRRVGILGLQQLILLVESLRRITLKDCTVLLREDYEFLRRSTDELGIIFKVI